MDQTTHAMRQSMWKDILIQCQNRPDGITAKQWLNENGISEKSYYYWQRKFRKNIFEQNNSASTELQSVHHKEEVSFVELPEPKVQINTDELNALVQPTAVLRAGQMTIAITNDISDSLLSRIIQEVAHA